MAEVIPFKGILYNPKKINNPADVVTPPYDIISKQEQQDFYQSHPQNIIRLILGRTTESDTIKNNRHTRASDFFNKWLSEGILVQDKSPAFYLTTVEFFSENKMVTRFGLTALVGLEPFKKGIVLPHEETFSRVKSERLELMKACHANFSPIFSLYSDNTNILNSLKDAAVNKKPDIDFIDKKGLRHRLGRITDPAVHRYVSDVMQGKTLFIADGHHRYETALNYRDWLSSNNPDFNADHPANYVMMHLSSMEDPGLTILPAHRMVTGAQASKLATLIQKCEKYFDIMPIPFEGIDREKARAQFISVLKSNSSKNIIGVLIKDRPEFYLLTLKAKIMEQLFGNKLADSLRSLDVTVLTRLILIELLGFDQDSLDDEKLITYSSCEKEAVNAVVSGKCDIAFILNPTKIEQVKNVAQEGLTMPKKSTYFYPKVLTGLVMNKLTT